MAELEVCNNVRLHPNDHLLGKFKEDVGPVRSREDRKHEQFWEWIRPVSSRPDKELSICLRQAR